MGLFNHLWSWMCRRVFKKVDYNGDGQIEPLEVEVAVLTLYSQVNKRLPGWQDPPTRDAIQAALRAFDTDGSGSLNEKEFEDFARSLMKSGPDQFFARVGKDAIVKTALLPTLSMGIKNSADQLGIAQLKDVPLAVLAPAVGCVFGAVRALIPV
ncbi:hypothetical protein Rsub_08218 [Raphidocelis subcapitata]|uniref:EF-hand domain-containing protein n=1 Tax=Raphidocelis subcapitata TaxID=307507 RepID=A0A2V0PA09_9CHLO|nr:hypothetical protein Rsub_08218 [Raphidocelis subcapitata]|eukprot:GBF95782.1 hypothetical protein Rsub_08218 [Raphidocelis subcapitata]